MTSDKTILEWVTGYKIEFKDQEPFQLRPPLQPKRTIAEMSIIQDEIEKLLSKCVIERVTHTQGEYISNIFVIPKKDGSNRVIFNLRRLNLHIRYHHFKMDSLASALKLMHKNCYMASVDLKDAYYSVPVYNCFRKFLRFRWKNELFQFTCLPMGITSAPRVFTKLLKPLFAYLRKQGVDCMGYIDDSFLLANSYEDCLSAVQQTVSLFQELGFIVHTKKSILKPSRELIYLGFMLNSTEMTVRPTSNKIIEVLGHISRLKQKFTPSVREVAAVIGYLVSLFPGVRHGPLFYRFLEREKTSALQRNFGNFDSPMLLSSQALEELSWWEEHLKGNYREILIPDPLLIIQTDASLFGWGAVTLRPHAQASGVWNPQEQSLHINVLELKAILQALKKLCLGSKDIHIRIQSDNTTAVAYVNNMGGSHSMQSNLVAKAIWLWAIERNIWISAAFLPGKDNVVADKLSRPQKHHTEWMLQPKFFGDIVARFGYPSIDLFASKFNKQIDTYASWKPDSKACFVDAFSVNWKDFYFYAFPPFSLIGKMIQKIKIDEAYGIVIVPDWPSQPWYTTLVSLLTANPIIIPQRLDMLVLPGDTIRHPLCPKLRLLACRLSGRHSECKDFHQNLAKLSFHHGEKEHKNNMQVSTESGDSFVFKGRWICFDRL